MKIELTIHYEDGRTQKVHYDLPLIIGRDAASGLCLKGWRVARQHARIIGVGDTAHLEDSGSLAGTLVNGKRAGPQTALQSGDEIIIGPCLIEVGRITLEPALRCEAPVTSPQPRNKVETGPAITNTDVGPNAKPAIHSESNVDSVVLPDASIVQSRLLLQRQKLHRLLLDALDLRR